MDADLVRLHGSMPLVEIGIVLGVSKAAIRGRITRLGIAKKRKYPPEFFIDLKNLYEACGADGFLNVIPFTQKWSIDRGNVSREAKKMGLPRNRFRRRAEDAAYRRHKIPITTEMRSEAMKKWHRNNEHPRGMLGKKHKPETKERLRQTSKQWSDSLTLNQRSEIALRAAKAKVAKYGAQAHKGDNGRSWKAGWREIGQHRKYFRSRWEANYARYLEWLRVRGHIADWKHEPETFWFEAIKRGVRSYLPDFRVWETDGSSKLHEVKGWMDDRSKTTLKRMAKYHPQEILVVVASKEYKEIERKMASLIEGWEK